MVLRNGGDERLFRMENRGDAVFPHLVDPAQEEPVVNGPVSEPVTDQVRPGQDRQQDRGGDENCVITQAKQVLPAPPRKIGPPARFNLILGMIRGIKEIDAPNGPQPGEHGLVAAGERMEPLPDPPRFARDEIGRAHV